MREVVRTWVNNYQLKYCKRVKAAARESAVVIAASTEAQRDLQRTLGIEIQFIWKPGCLIKLLLRNRIEIHCNLSESCGQVDYANGKRFRFCCMRWQSYR